MTNDKLTLLPAFYDRLCLIIIRLGAPPGGGRHDISRVDTENQVKSSYSISYILLLQEICIEVKFTLDGNPNIKTSEIHLTK